MNLYQSPLPAVITTIPVLYTLAEYPLKSQHENLLENLLESLVVSLLESVYESLTESRLERTSHGKEKGIPREAFDLFETYNEWTLRLFECSMFVEASKLMLM